MNESPRVAPPSPEIAALARERLAGLATPPGALGRVGELGVWLSAAQGVVPPRPLTDVRLVVLAGDHGVAAHGVSAYPAAITEAMVRTLVAGRAGVSALAREHGVAVTVLDVAVDADLDDLPAEVTARKVRRGSGAIHLTDALTREEAERSIALGAELAGELVDDGAQLLMTGDLGIGNTTVAAALVAATLGLPADEVTGRGTGIDDDGWTRKRDVVAQALARTEGRTSDPVEVLTALGSADLAATVGFLVEAVHPRRAGPARRPHVGRLRGRGRGPRTRCGRLVARRPPLHRARPGPRAEVPRPRAAPRPRDAPGRGLGRRHRAAAAALRDRGAA